MTDIGLLVMLVIGHIFCDFYLQPKAWVETRNELHWRALELLYHAASHGVMTFVILILVASQGFWLSLSFGVAVLVTHYIIDLIKSYLPDTEVYFIADQGAHLVVLTLTWLIVADKLTEYSALLSPTTWNSKYIIILAAYLIILKPASIVISKSFSPWDPKKNNTNTPAAGATEQPNLAGQRIGYLERILILTFILLNQFSAIGFLLAAKSVFRFGDLSKDEDKKLTEYVMLGTLTSFTLTILIGLSTNLFFTYLLSNK